MVEKIARPLGMKNMPGLDISVYKKPKSELMMLIFIAMCLPVLLIKRVDSLYMIFCSVWSFAILDLLCYTFIRRLKVITKS